MWWPSLFTTSSMQGQLISLLPKSPHYCQAHRRAMGNLALQTESASGGPMVAPRSLFVTVVIVNWNSGTMLRPCLRAVTRETGGLRVRGVVIDNKSRDGSAELVERGFPQVTLIRAGAN